MTAAPSGNSSASTVNNEPSVGPTGTAGTTTTALTVDSRKTDTLLPTKSQKDIQVKSKENVVSRAPQPVPLEEPAAVTKAHTAAAAAAPIGPATVPDHKTRPHRSTLLSSGGSQHLTSLRRCLSKVRFNIDHAAEWPLRVRRMEPARRVLPPVPDPGRLAKRSDDGTSKSGQEYSEGVRLVCRVKPSTQFAQDRMVVSDQEVEIRPVIIKKSWLAPATKTDHWKFTMNKAIYGGTQEEVYQEIFHTPLLKAMDGISGFVMLCGRKATGKSYTSRGEDRHYDYRGIIPRALQQVFREIQARNFEYDIRVSVSYYDLVGETVLDLLAEQCHLDMTECSYQNMTYIKELVYARISNENDALFIYFLANYNRLRLLAKYGDKPVEPHTLFTFYFEIHSKLLTEEVFKVSKLTLLELASTTNLARVPKVVPSLHGTLLETNKSVGELEKAMMLRLTGDMPIKKIPCRQSKLIYALKDILTDERAKITVVACVSAELEHLKDTIASLKFTSRFKGIHVRPAVNRLPDQAARLRVVQEQADMLKTELRMYDLLINFSLPLHERHHSNARESPDYVANTGAQDLFRTAREVKDFVEGRTPVPKFATYKQLDNFLGLMKKLAKDGDLPTEPAEIPDAPSGNPQVTVNNTDDGRTSPGPKDFLDVDGVGELDDRDGVGVGTAPGGAKGKNVKSLMKKKKDEKNAKVEKPSVIINGKKPGGAMPRKGEKAGSGATANSPLKDHLSDAGHPAESPTKPDQLKTDDAAAPKPGDLVTDNIKLLGATSGPMGSIVVPATGSTVRMLAKAIPKAEAYLLFTTKIPNGVEPFKVTETQRQMVAVKERSVVTLAASVNGWIDQLNVEQCSLEELVYERSRTRPQTTGEIPVLTFEEHKVTAKIKQLRYLIETGHRDIHTCQTDLAGLRLSLAKSRQQLLTSFEEWYARAYNDGPCEPVTGSLPGGNLINAAAGGGSVSGPTAQPDQLDFVTPVQMAQPAQALLPAQSASGTLSSALIMAPNMKMDQPRSFATPGVPVDGAGAVTHGVEASVTAGLRRPPCPVKVAPKDAAELHKTALEPFLDPNPEAAKFYRMREKVRQIVRVREENEAYHRLNPRSAPRKLDPELKIDFFTFDLPSALRPKPTKNKDLITAPQK